MNVMATLILCAGVFDDLRTQKIHNKLILALLALTVLALLILSGPYAFIPALYSFLLALAFALPLTLAGVLGAGDMKLFAVFALATDMVGVTHVAIFSVVWGALLGLLRALFMGKARELLLSTTQLIWMKGGPAREAFKFPYSVALLFGWLSHLTVTHLGMSLW
jgi:Flp pilus assembly protein protease CpaA